VRTASASNAAINPADPAGTPALWWAAVGGLCLALLAPLALVDVPPLLDYPNHLARLFVLAFGPTDPVLARFYAPRWGIIPDLGIDLLGLPLLYLLPVHLAGRVIIGVVVLTPVLGSIAYSRAAFGRASWWALGSGLVAYNQMLLLGFLNFTLGLGLALWLAAAWVAWRETRPWRTLAIVLPGAAALFFCHLMGLLFLALLLAAHELAWLWRTRDWTRLGGRVAAALAVGVVPAGLYAVSSLQEMEGESVFPSLATKASQLLAPFVNLILPLDIASAVLVAGVALGLLLSGRCRVAPSAGIALALSLLLYAVSPAEFKGTANLDARFVILLGYLLFASLMPLRMPRPLAVALVLLFAVRMAVLGVAWYGHNADIADLRAVIAQVEPGSTVFVTAVDPAEAPAFWDTAPLARRLSTGMRTDVHLPALLLIERRAWWPFLFDNLSQQPVRTREPYRTLADRVGGIPPHDAVRDPKAVDLCGYDALLLLDAAGEPDPAHFARDRLELRADRPYAALYAVRPDVACQPAITGLPGR
jgi:hypothetical protein